MSIHLITFVDILYPILTNAHELHKNDSTKKKDITLKITKRLINSFANDVRLETKNAF